MSPRSAAGWIWMFFFLVALASLFVSVLFVQVGLAIFFLFCAVVSLGACFAAWRKTRPSAVGAVGVYVEDHEQAIHRVPALAAFPLPYSDEVMREVCLLVNCLPCYRLSSVFVDKSTPCVYFFFHPITPAKP